MLYSPQNLVETLQLKNGELREINQGMKIGHAKTANIRITNCNRIMQEPMEFLPLQKTVGSMDGGSTIQHYTNICFQVPGHGQNRAFALTEHNPQL